jgi:hypothetical protein
MHVHVYALFEGTPNQGGQHHIDSWEMFYWPAVVVAQLLPQALESNKPVWVSARLLRQRLPGVLEVVAAAVSTEETETTVDEAEALSWQLRDGGRAPGARTLRRSTETAARRATRPRTRGAAPPGWSRP